jgi:GTP-binding nuclear protein Ran
MVDQSCRASYQRVPTILQDIQRICQNIPVLLCVNKVDLNPPLRFSETYARNLATNNGLDYTLISVKRNSNLDSPFQYLLRKLINEHCTFQ